MKIVDLTGRKFVSRFIEPGMVYYKEFGDVLITKETLEFKAKQPTDCVWDKSTLEDMVLVRGK